MAARQIAQPQISNSHPHQPLHFVSDRIQHSANLPIKSLSQDNAQSRLSNWMKPRDLGALTIQKNPAQKLLRVRAVPLSIQGDFVFLLELESWMSQSLREIAVVRQQEQSLALRVEPADIEKARKF